MIENPGRLAVVHSFFNFLCPTRLETASTAKPLFLINHKHAVR